MNNTERSLLQDYADFVESRRKDLDTHALNLHHMTTGLATEAGEALGVTKAIWVYGQPLNRVNKEGQTHYENLLEEAGDVLFYLQGLATLLGVSLLDLMARNRAKLEMRYPAGYSDKDAAERKDKLGSNWEQLELDLFRRLSGEEGSKA